MKFLLMMANDIPKILKQEVIDLEKIKNVIFYKIIKDFAGVVR